MNITPTIEIYFSNNTSEKYTAYNVEDNHEEIRICSFIFYNILNFYDNENDNIAYFLSVHILQNRF